MLTDGKLLYETSTQKKLMYIFKTQSNDVKRSKL